MLKISSTLLWTCSALLLLSGCAVTNDKTGWSGIGMTYQSNVKTLSDGVYYTEAEAAPGAGRISGARGIALKSAHEHCKKMEKKESIIDISEDSNFLVNGVVRLKFKCE